MEAAGKRVRSIVEPKRTTLTAWEVDEKETEGLRTKRDKLEKWNERIGEELEALLNLEGSIHKAEGHGAAHHRTW